MRKFFLTLLVVSACAASALAQSSEHKGLRIVTEDPNLPSEIFYGNTRVKPLRLRPGTNTPITINDADFFVQQQYVDFLSRFPDQPGLNFWAGQITGCGANATCVDGQRTNTSGAFFLSIEFQETGFLVYKLNRASFNRRPVYASFMPDTRQVANGVIVGQGTWQALLETNKKNFLNAWVARPEFLAEFPANMTPAAFVDKLIANTGLAPETFGRDALVNALANNTKTRAAVLREIAENAAFGAQEKNPAFVQMQYFGYLRRDPDDAGFTFWLGKLNNHNGDFHSAEMVRSFIVSGEYIG
ncbi:MAG TPA: DUF4214 domain-containing protein, partial [Pyrinomonadaceae bacterium]|nr:DUF4214 domain-containing protein [Pyrinomonadaceae bacterium]